MNKKTIIIAVLTLVAITLLGLCGLAFILNNSRNAAEQQGRQANPNFHTVEEGGACTPDKGDCKEGLTCNNGTCAKP